MKQEFLDIIDEREVTIVSANTEKMNHLPVCVLQVEGHGKRKTFKKKEEVVIKSKYFILKPKCRE